MKQATNILFAALLGLVLSACGSETEMTLDESVMSASAAQEHNGPESTGPGIPVAFDHSWSHVLGPTPGRGLVE
ncbi:MAG: hypothetical protein QGI45_08330 [Myxococcota bacterium]|jgi:hypothetical protein|nr:hypothetical protein [Myxococcota bacterium]